ENAGLLALTRVGSRRVVQISACFMLFFSILGKFGALFASISMPIIAAFYCVLFAYVASAGIGFLQFCNLNSFRTKFILGFSIFMGFSCLFLGLHTLPQGQCSAQRLWFGLVG
ncbi:hypothetical protein MKX03_018565, partial [Papaver bracteatum]